MKTPNERIRILRKYLGLTQDKLGKIIGLEWYQIKDIEAGKVKVSPMIAKILHYEVGANIEWILTGNGNMLSEKVESNICRESQSAYLTEDTTWEEKRYIKLLMDIFHGKNEKAKVAIKENIETFHQLCDIPDRQSQKKPMGGRKEKRI